MRRRLYDPYALSVRWEPSEPDLVADWPSLVRLGTTVPGRPDSRTWAAGPAGLVGSDNDLIDVLDRVPTRRLIVLGEPGAGKTMLLVRLVLDLLLDRRRGSGDQYRSCSHWPHGTLRTRTCAPGSYNR